MKFKGCGRDIIGFSPKKIVKCGSYNSEDDYIYKCRSCSSNLNKENSR